MEVKTKKRGKTVTVVHFIDAVDFTEVAAILIEALEKIYKQSPALALHYASLEPLDPQAFGEELALMFEPTDIQELMCVDQGPGIILGMYFARMELHDAEEQADAEAYT